MAYVQSTAVTWKGIIGGRKAWIFTVTETGIVDANSEWSFTANLPVVGTITRMAVAVTKGAGTATTVLPLVGSATSKSDIALAAGSTAIAATVTDVANHRFAIATHALFGKSGANGSADSAVTTITVTEGHF